MDIDFRLQRSNVTPDHVHKETIPEGQEPEVRSSKRPSKKGRRRRKRAKVKRDIEGEDKTETFPSEKTFKTSKVLKYFGMKRFDKVRSTFPKPDKSDVSWLDAADDDLTDDDQVVEIESKNKQSSKISWLDVDDDDETFYKPDLKPVRKVPEETEGQNSNLNSYRRRFFSASQAGNDEPHDWSKKLDEPNMATGQIGSVVRKKDKYDGTKRSRRKTEPFDFAKQAEGDLDENESSHSLPDFVKTYRSSWEIPSGLCNFMADNNENSPKYQMKNSPNSIYGKGLFVPFADFDGKLTRELSLEKIFNEEYDKEGSDSGTECAAVADKENSESEDDDDHWQNEIVEVLPPEPQLGNVEYKLKLVNPTRQRFEHLVTQVRSKYKICLLSCSFTNRCVCR